MVTAAVLAKTTISDDTPIALDAGISWFYSDPKQIRDACEICKLAGVKWVRDRLSWPEIETARGTWAGDTRYEKAMRIEHESGLKILQVNHISPPWAAKDPRHFPDDLRDVYNFYRGLAKRWNGLADAIEPWNEPDLDIFGGHTGCEIASFQKAAYPRPESRRSRSGRSTWRSSRSIGPKHSTSSARTKCLPTSIATTCTITSGCRPTRAHTAAIGPSAAAGRCGRPSST